MADKELKTQCPECDADVTVKVDEEGDYEGTCPNCHLNVGRVLTKRRYEKAAARLTEREENAGKKNRKKSDPFS